jgi:hypothetical protein
MWWIDRFSWSKVKKIIHITNIVFGKNNKIGKELGCKKIQG